MVLTAIVLVALTKRVGWVDWQEQLGLIADYYVTIRNDALELVSLLLPFDLPGWSGDAALLWWTWGQAQLLHYVLDSDYPQLKAENVTLPMILFFGVLAPVFFFPFHIYSSLRWTFGAPYTEEETDEYLAGIRNAEGGEELFQEAVSVYGEEKARRVFGPDRSLLTTIRHFPRHIFTHFLREVLPSAILLTSIFWLALAANYYTALFLT